MAQPISQEKIRGAIFDDPSEQYLCVAGSKQMEKFVRSGKPKKGFAVLSDRAIYCKGTCQVSRDRRKFRKDTRGRRIGLDDFEGMKYLQQKNPVLLTLAFFFLLLGPALLLLDKVLSFGERIALNPTLDGVICILLAGVFFLLYLIHKKNLLELLHTNGSLGIDTQFLPPKEEKLLIRYLRAYLNSREGSL